MQTIFLSLCSYKAGTRRPLEEE